MNPAALQGNELPRLEPAARVIVNDDTFDERNLTKAGLRRQPARRTAASTGYTVFEVPMTTLTLRAPSSRSA